MSQREAYEHAKQISLDFGDDVLVFSYLNPQGEQWEGCLDEWIGNDSLNDFNAELPMLNGRRFSQIGSGGGGADLVLLRDDGAVCYMNDFDQQLSEVAASVDAFVALLRRP